ncbi:hypothetical protein B7463_g10539, partial [Scytalidium lignicola]
MHFRVGLRIFLFLAFAGYLARDPIARFIACMREPGPSFNPHEIADLLSNYYQLLQRMRYIPASSIKYPPHSPPINVSLAQSLGLEPQVIELLQLLPYVENTGSEDEFIMFGSFMDYRADGALELSRDPDYASPEGGFDDENGQYVQPWIIPLSECGNHGSIIYLDTRNSEITMLWQAGGGDGSSDPFFYGKPAPANKPLPHPVNRNRIEHFPSRPATDFFADFTNRLMTLEWIPDSKWMHMVVHYPESTDLKADEEWSELRTIFLEFGWPDNFDGPSFDDAMHRYYEFSKVRREMNDLEFQFKVREDFYKSGMKQYQELLQRKNSNGVWDNDPNKSPAEIEELEEQVRNAKEAIERCKDEYEEMKKDYEASMYRDADTKWNIAWYSHFRELYRYNLHNYEWMTGQGKAHVTEEDLENTRQKMDRLKYRMENVSKEPRTVMKAIKQPRNELDIQIYS